MVSTRCLFSASVPDFGSTTPAVFSRYASLPANSATAVDYERNDRSSLVIARTLLEQAQPLCTAEDRYIASAGLVILQDALEVVLYALLLELGVDEKKKNLESKSFDELVGEGGSA